jgi:hypothetical protein
MTREQLVKGLKQRLVDSTVDEYRAQLDDHKNLYQVVPRLRGFYQSLTLQQRDMFFEIVRQIEIDTVADFFSFLDGAYWVEGQTEDVALISANDNQNKLNENLTDLFLNLVHSWKR